ncbi:MAG: hypothetical protein Q8888_02075 [Vigna little leaf phytoplasma]|nr:hypothetical protein [Vigna little leaf phytoplasma]
MMCLSIVSVKGLSRNKQKESLILFSTQLIIAFLGSAASGRMIICSFFC